MNRNISLLAAVLAVLLVAIAPSLALAQAKPNIVFIMGDDIGMWKYGRVSPGTDGRANPEQSTSSLAKAPSLPTTMRRRVALPAEPTSSPVNYRSVPD